VRATHLDRKALIVKPLLIAASVVAAGLLSACTAHAKPEPGKFPDISGYTPVHVDDYRIDTTSPGHPTSATYFLTPDGIVCGFSPGLGAGCTGNGFPATPPQPWDPAAGLTGVNSIDTITGLGTSNAPISMDNKTILGQRIKTLPPFHSIAIYGAICGVDDEKTTACKDSQGRGFVLSPTWTEWLPKV